MIKLLEKANRIITLGPEGTFSNQAASLVGGNKPISYTNTLPQIALEVVADPSALGVMPIENSSSGIVGPAQDALVENQVVIIAEALVAVSYALVANRPLHEITGFFCHEVAFNQCMNFTARHLPKARVLYSQSNMDSAQQFLKEPKDSKIAAIVPRIRAQQDPALSSKILEEKIEDYLNNSTRFAVIKVQEPTDQPDFTKHKTSLLIESHEDRHGLLFEILREFHVFGLNLCRLESRPSKIHPWQYRFFIDFYNNHRSATCLEALKSQKIDFKVLGTYSSLT